MALPYTDTFTAASNSTLQAYSANWTISAGAFTVDATNDAVYPNSSGAECGAFVNSETPSADQYAQVVLSNIVDANASVGPAVRCAAGGNYYGLYYSRSGGGMVFLFKMVSGTWTGIAESIGVGAWANGDVLRLEVSGTTLTPKRNGTLITALGTKTDSSLSSGKVGICGYDALATCRLDNFEGGNLGGGAQTVTPAAITSGAVVYAPTVGRGAVTVAPAFVASAAQVFAPVVSQGGAQTVAPAFIAGAAQVFAPAVGRGAITVVPAAITSAAQVFSPVVTRAAVTITPATITSTAQVYAPTVARGAVTVTPNAVASGAQVFAPGVLARATVGGVLTADVTNGRYFRNGSGLVLLAGFHTWYEFQDGGLTYPPAAFDYAAWLDYLDARGVNFHKMWVLETARGWSDADAYFDPLPWARTGPGNAADGRPKFDLTQFNQAYFDRLRERVILAGNRGHYVAAQLFQGWNITAKGMGNYPFVYHPLNGPNNINGIDGDADNDNEGEETRNLANTAIIAIQAAYVEKVVDTLNDLDNVLWEISNEEDGTTQTNAWQNHWIAHIHDYEAGKPKQHPVGFTVAFPNGDDAVLTASAAEWISPKNGSSLTPGTAGGAQVILFDTDHIVGLTTEHEWVWQSFTRGYNPVYMDVYDGALYGADMRADAAHERIRNNLGWVLDYAARLNLQGATPQNSLSSTGYCLAGSTQLVAYQHTSGAFTVNLASYSGIYSVEWLRSAATTPTTQAGSNVSGGAVRTLTPPWSGEDAVALLEKLADEIAPAFIASTAQVFGPTVARGAVTVAPSAIASAAVVYAPAVGRGAVTVAPGAIASAAQVFAVAVTAGAVTVAPDAITSTATVHAPAVGVGAVAVTPAFIASAAQVFSPALTQEGAIVPDAITSAEQVFTLVVTVGAVTVAAGFVVSAEQVFAPTVTTGAQVVPDAIASNAQVFAVTVTAGAVTVVPDAIAGSAQVYAPTVQPGAVVVAPDAIASVAQVFAVTVTAASAGIHPDTIAAGAQVFAPAVAVGPVTVVPDAIAPAAQVFAPFVGTGTTQTVAMGFVPSVAQVFTVVLLAIPASRIYRVAAESRTFVVEFVDRTYTVQGE